MSNRFCYKKILLFLLFKLFCLCLLAQPVADFDVLIKKGCSPLEVTFINNSIPEVGLSYQWILGNGNFSVLTEPYAIYSNPGSYTVTLIVSDGIQSDTLTKENFITVYQNPEVDFTITGAHTGCVPLKLAVENLTVQGDTTINTWNWDFGDGNISNDSVPLFDYIFPGTFNLLLVAIDNHGCSGSKLLENYMEVYKTNSSFYANQNESCSGELNIAFSNLSNGSGPLQYSWDFGDGNSSSETEPVYTYTSSGIFSVSLIAVDNHGCADTLTKLNYVNIIEVAASFNLLNDTVCKNDVVNFTNTSVNANVYKWSFGDGSYSTIKNPNHMYTNAGDYLISLIASKYDACSDTVYFSLHVEQVVADFTVSDNYACELPFFPQYLDNSTNAVTWNWRFGSGHSSNMQNPIDSILFVVGSNNIHYFSDSLIVFSAAGCKDVKVVNQNIIIQIPKANFTPNNMISELSGCIPLIINFNNQSNYYSNYDSIVEWHWSFSDWSNSTDWNTSRTYYDAGEYNVTLSFITAKGCIASYSDSVYAGTEQFPYFTIDSPDSICSIQDVTFLNLSSDQNLIDQYYWLFSDGTSLSIPEPIVQFVDTGYISGILIAEYNGCESMYIKDSLIYVKGPVVFQSSSFQCNQPYTYTFTGEVLGAENFYWSFGDLSPDVYNVDNVIHTFNASGDYHIEIFAENETNGCQYHTSDYIFAREIKSEFTNSGTNICPGTLIHFDGSASHDVDDFNFNNYWVNYLWYFSDNSTYYFPTDTISHLFNTKGFHEISLIVSDINGCRDTLTKTIHVFQPAVNFSSDYQQGCIPASFSFTNQTQSDTSITGWLWQFGDNTSSFEQNPVHEYQNFGNYNVSLWVSDTLGCDSILTKLNYINVQKPDPSFLSSDNTLCADASAIFYDNSNSTIASYFWDFGDGSTSSDSIPNHAYQDTGYFSVSLHIVDNHGCDSTGIQQNFIHVQKPPQVDFITDIYSATCYPEQIHFLDCSITDYPADWCWNFGDNTNPSYFKNPAHTYYKPGVYDVSLIVTTTYGCSDTLLKNSFITIGGPWAKIIHPDTICIFDTVSLFVSEKLNVFDLKWDLGNGNFSVSDTANMAFSSYGNVFPSIMLYTDSVHTCDVVITDTINVYRVIADFNVNNGDFDGCVPLDITINDISENAKYYAWYINDLFLSSAENIDQTLMNAGTYNVTLIIRNDFVCYDTISKNITVFPLPQVTISSDTLMCRGSETQMLAGGGTEYYWTPETGLNNPFLNNPIANPDSSLTYSVSVRDANGCVEDTFVNITVYQVPVLDLKDTTVVIGENIYINAMNSEIVSYNWSPNISISCTDCPNPVITPLEPTVYTVAITDSNNCFTVDYQVVVDIMKKYSVDVPDIFTPNGDGFNDYVYVRGWGIQELLDFRIFNRFGEMVFESRNLLNGWNGSYNGADQGTETFTYFVRVRTYSDEILSKKGFIKLMR